MRIHVCICIRIKYNLLHWIYSPPPLFFYLHALLWLTFLLFAVPFFSDSFTKSYHVYGSACSSQVYSRKKIVLKVRRIMKDRSLRIYDLFLSIKLSSNNYIFPIHAVKCKNIVLELKET